MSIQRVARHGQPRRELGSTKTGGVDSEERRQRLGSREDLNRGIDAMDDRQRAGLSETAGRNRHPRFYVSQGEYSPMLKPLTLSLSLAVALGFCSVSMAGIHAGCSTCGLASPQGGPVASAQGPIATCDVVDTCGQKCRL